MDENNPNNHSEISLHLAAAVQFEHVTASFIQQSCLAWGLPEEAAASLAQAGQQIFAHLAQTELQDHPVKLVCKGDPSYGRVDIIFSGRESAAHGHASLTSAIHKSTRHHNHPFHGGNTHRLIEHIALAIAVGQVDRFSTTLEKTNVTRLTLIREKTYPEEIAIVPLPLSHQIRVFRLATPQEIPLLIRYARQKYSPAYLPPVFRYPDNVADRLRRGETHAIVGVSENGELCGAIFWESTQRKVIQCTGPYVFTPGRGQPEALMEGLLHALAKHPVVCLLNTNPTPDFPAQTWEKAGSLKIQPGDASAPLERDVYIRSMIEDPGCIVWAHPDLHPYLQAQYHRLALPRELRPAPEMDVQGDAILSVDYERDENRISLRPLDAGVTNRQTLAEHVALLRDQDIQMILFEMDLGVPIQTSFTPALLQTGFVPRVLLPHAGEGDLVLFQFNPEQVYQANLHGAV